MLYSGRARVNRADIDQWCLPTVLFSERVRLVCAVHRVPSRRPAAILLPHPAHLHPPPYRSLPDGAGQQTGASRCKAAQNVSRTLARIVYAASNLLLTTDI